MDVPYRINNGVIEYYVIGIPIPESSPLHPKNPNYQSPDYTIVPIVPPLRNFPRDSQLFRQIPFPQELIRGAEK